MTVAATTRLTLRRRAVRELRELLIITAYLYVCLGAVIFYKAAVLRGQGIGFTPWGVAVVKALILAKFMMIGHAVNLGGSSRGRPLIWPTLQRSVTFLLLLLLLTVIEEVVVGWIHGRAFVESVMAVGGGTFLQLFAACLIMFLILLPYFAFRSLGEVLGEGQLARVFFVNRTPAT